MPSYDGGHYFLTMLAPIRTDSVSIQGRHYRSHVDLLREALTRLPTARQNVVTRNSRLNSPFARNRLNHLVRFFVIDDVVFNGRVSGNSLIDQVRGINPIIAQPMDRLLCSYLLFAADIDAAAAGEGALRTYTDELWSTMRAELTEVFQHCLGFDAVQDADGFFRYVERCQLETTMPFNDYWIDPLPTKSVPFKAMLGALAGVSAATLCAFVLHVLGIGDRPWGELSLWGLGVTLALGVGGYRYLVVKGEQPFPTAPNSDLPSVLKALYLQQRFTDFAIANQGVDAGALYRDFRTFIAQHRPDDLDDPTQPPGVISSTADGVAS